MKPTLILFSALLSLTTVACTLNVTPPASLNASTSPSASASTPASASPSPPPSPATSTSPSPSSSTVAASSSVTVTRQAYATYLGCMNEKHPNKGYLSIQQLVNTGIYDAHWSDAYKLNADGSVKINSDTYGKECGA